MPSVLPRPFSISSCSLPVALVARCCASLGIASLGLASLGLASLGLASLGLASLGLAPLALAQAAPATLAPDRSQGALAVTVDQCRQWLFQLSSPEFEGRATGQPGFQKAADYVAAHFQALGLEVRGDDGTYFQNVPWATAKVDEAKTFVSFRKGDDEVRRIAGARLAGNATTSVSAHGDVVLLVVAAPEGQATGGARPRGEGFELPNLPGLAELEVADQVVVVFIATTEATRAGVPMARFAVRQALQGKEPAMVLFAETAEVSGGLLGRAGGGRGAGNAATAGGRRAPPTVTFGGKDLDALLAASGLDAGVLTTDATAKLVPLPVHAEVVLQVAEGKAPAMNVFAVLPGSDPKLKDEYVVIGSHLDHLGRNGGTLYPGADDDGSGTTGVMAMAQMFAKNPVRPARSLLFVCFCGEESGLLGSRYFADHCPVPLSSIVGELQMDMIGRDEEEGMDGRTLVNPGEKAEDNRNSLHLVGTEKLAPAMHELCVAKNATAGFDLEYDQENLFSRSDHANFGRLGVPIAFFFTGLHRDYHKPTDTPDKINFPKLLRIARYVYDIGFELATEAGRPEIDPDLWAKYPRPGSKEPAAPLHKKGG